MAGRAERCICGRNVPAGLIFALLRATVCVSCRRKYFVQYFFYGFFYTAERFCLIGDIKESHMYGGVSAVMLLRNQ